MKKLEGHKFAREQNGSPKVKKKHKRKKRHQTHNIIHELVKNDDVLTEDEDILSEMCNFYEKLYTSKSIPNNEINNYLEVSNVNELSYKNRDMCDTFPSLEECKETVMKLKPNQTPELDGLPNEFNKCFWNQISLLFYGMLKEIMTNREMTFS